MGGEDDVRDLSKYVAARLSVNSVTKTCWSVCCGINWRAVRMAHSSLTVDDGAIEDDFL